MAEDSNVGIEDIIEDLDYSTPSGSRSSSLDRGSYMQSSFQDPHLFLTDFSGWKLSTRSLLSRGLT